MACYNQQINLSPLKKTVTTPGFSITTSYDKRQRPEVQLQTANGKTVSRKTQYDFAGNPTHALDANTKLTQTEYDKLGRVSASIDATTGRTEFTYDARDNLLKVTDPEGRVTQYTYTLCDELESETKHDYIGTNKQRRYEYDANGNLAMATTPNQEKQVYHYDLQNRLVQREIFAHKDYAQPIKVVDYHYNTKDQYTGYSQVAGADTDHATADVVALSESYSYNALDQLETVTVNFGPFSKSYGYSYYPNGIKKTYTNPEGITYTYAYNHNNQLVSVDIPGEGQIAWTDFNWLAPQTQLLPGGNKILSQYDDLLRLSSRSLKDAADKTLGSASYSYDAENNITAIATEHGNYSYGYDDVYRLTGVDYPAANPFKDETFEYDHVGNRLKRIVEGQTGEYKYNDHNQLQSILGSLPASFSYDANGNTIQKLEGGVTTQYTYNAEERMIGVSDDAVQVGAYVYNPYGQRVRKVAQGETTYFLYNLNGMAAEYDASGVLVKEYHFNPQAPWMTEPLFQRVATGEIYYYQDDHLGTPQKLLSKSGALAWAGRWSAFGEVSVVGGVTGNALRFPGQYGDLESGLSQNYFRDYSARLGRYVQGDPIGLRGGFNTYGYGLQNPLYFRDQNGLEVDIVFNKCAGTVTVTDRDSHRSVVAPAFSGDGDKKQPIPNGNYTLTTHPWGKKHYYPLVHDDETFDDEVDGYPSNYDNSKNMSNLRFHPGPISDACLTVPNVDRKGTNNPKWQEIEEMLKNTKPGSQQSLNGSPVTVLGAVKVVCHGNGALPPGTGPWRGPQPPLLTPPGL